MKRKSRLPRRKYFYFAEELSPSGEGMFRLRISPKDIDFYKVRGYKIVRVSKK